MVGCASLYRLYGSLGAMRSSMGYPRNAAGVVPNSLFTSFLSAVPS